ncbi:spermidine synthase [Streptomyces sp. NPDC021093]|uniref:spermidine synthase n=1 Tax=Streptomyces sp. NPDC021093 TaxID=3365112 RepID=UPI003798F504
MSAPTESPVLLDRREGPHGEVVLRRRGEATYEIIANGCFLMDTSDGRSERLLVDAAHAAHAAHARRAVPGCRTASGMHVPRRPSLLIGGLGVGFSLVHAAAQEHWGAITVVEREEAIVDWHVAGPLGAISGAALADPRVSVLCTDLVAHLCAPVRTQEVTQEVTYEVTYDVLCLDIDNGPDWTVTDDNRGLYTPVGLAACRARLNPGGVLAVWSAQPSARFEQALRDAGFEAVRTEEVAVARGVPDVVHLARNPD